MTRERFFQYYTYGYHEYGKRLPFENVNADFARWASIDWPNFAQFFNEIDEQSIAKLPILKNTTHDVRKLYYSVGPTTFEVETSDVKPDLNQKGIPYQFFDERLNFFPVSLLQAKSDISSFLSMTSRFREETLIVELSADRPAGKGQFLYGSIFMKDADGKNRRGRRLAIHGVVDNRREKVMAHYAEINNSLWSSASYRGNPDNITEILYGIKSIFEYQSENSSESLKWKVPVLYR